MRKFLLAVMLCAAPLLAQASTSVHLDKVKIDLHDKASLQRGAQLFTNYCMGCHAASYLRYNGVAQDIGVSEELMLKNLVFAGEKIGEYMSIATPVKDAKAWFGVAPPDLSVIARARGNDWLYTYLRGFYLDEARPFGVNNVVFKDVGMPHALWELQGWQKLVPADEHAAGGHGAGAPKFEIVTPGSMSPEDYDDAMTDLVNFLAYMGEPAKLERQSLGIKVLLFLVVFFVIALLLKKEYWKDIH